MALAHEDVAIASGGRRWRGRRNIVLLTGLFCFGSRSQRGHEASAAAAAEGTTTPWERSRRRAKKRTVPVVDGDLVAGTAADSEAMRRGTGTGTGTSTSDEESSRKRKGLRLPGCSCFLAPARAPGREHSAMDSSGSDRSKQRHPERTEQPPPRWRRSQSDKNSPSEAASRIQVTGGSLSTSIGSSSRGAEQPRGAPPAETTPTPTGTKPSKTTGTGGVGASFGPVVGLSVAVTVSMVGLLGGRLWAVACVCAWLAALSRLRRRETTTAADGEVDVVVAG